MDLSGFNLKNVHANPSFTRSRFRLYFIDDFFHKNLQRLLKKYMKLNPTKTDLQYYFLGKGLVIYLIIFVKKIVKESYIGEKIKLNIHAITL